MPETISVVSCVWFPAHAKDAKLLLEQTLGFVRREDIVLANRVYVTIEAAGSGKVLVSLLVNRAASIRQLKEQIFDVLCKNIKDWSSWRDICLFQGQGGSEVVRVDNLARDTTLVLATRLVKTGVFFNDDRIIHLQHVYLANKFLVTQDAHGAFLWDLWTGKRIRHLPGNVLSVGDVLLVIGWHVGKYFVDTKLSVRTVEENTLKHTFTIAGLCRCVFLLRHDKLLVAVTLKEFRVYDVVNKCQLWMGENIYSKLFQNVSISPTGGLITFTVNDGGGRVYISNGENGLACSGSCLATSWHEKLCSVPQPTLTASLVHGNGNVMVARTTC